MTTPFSKLRDTAMTDPAQPDEYAKLKAQKEAILLRQSPNKKLLSRLVELKELVENYHGVFPNRAVIAEALRDAAAALVSPPVQSVEATPMAGDAEREIERAMLHGPDQRTLDALKLTLARAKSAEHDFIQVHKNCIEARKRAEDAERQLHLAQTENAGHIRIEDELKAELKIQDDANEILQRRLDETQARCAELEKLLAEAVKDRSDANYTLGTDLVDRIDSALKPLRIPE